MKEQLMTSDQYVVQELLQTKKELEEAKQELNCLKDIDDTLMSLCEVIANSVSEEESGYAGLVNVYLKGQFVGSYWEKDLDKVDDDFAAKAIVKLARLIKSIPSREE